MHGGDDDDHDHDDHDDDCDDDDHDHDDDDDCRLGFGSLGNWRTMGWTSRSYFRFLLFLLQFSLF